MLSYWQRSQMVMFYWNILYWEVPLNSSGRANILVCCVRTWMFKLIMKCILNHLSLHTDPPRYCHVSQNLPASLSLSLQPLGCCECIFVSTWCCGCRRRCDRCWHKSSTRCKKNNKINPKTERKFIILKISFIAVKTQKKKKTHWNTSRDRMIETLPNKATDKEPEETACRGSHFLKTQFHRMTT